jgi:competence protein ComFC
MKTIHKICEYIISFIFPKRCCLCGKTIPANMQMCEQCSENLPIIGGNICKNCGREKNKCCCKNKKFEFERCVAPFYYEGAVKRGIWRYKYRKKLYAAAAFAYYTAKTVNNEYTDINFDIITAVPMSKKEYSNRGYNQSVLLARLLAKELNVKYCDVLIKTIDTKPQQSCNATQRRGNIFGVFKAADISNIKDKTILLVDDISTTGATLNECAKMLKLAGAKCIYCVVIAAVK